MSNTYLIGIRIATLSYLGEILLANAASHPQRSMIGPKEYPRCFIGHFRPAVFRAKLVLPRTIGRGIHASGQKLGRG
jgi:hypothetical protein